jgi:hypothetical protein
LTPGKVFEMLLMVRIKSFEFVIGSAPYQGLWCFFF